ncbi:MAG: hypothetical protein AAF551_06385 [Bacteroidota bacterium]
MKNEENSDEDIHLRDLFSLKGTISFNDYKIVMVVLVGVLIVIPLAVPAFVFFVQDQYAQNPTDMSVLVEFTNPVVVILCLPMMTSMMVVTIKLIKGRWS